MMYGNTQYRPATQQWTTLDPAMSQNFLGSKNTLTQTRGGSQVLETQTAQKPGLGGKIANIVHRAEERFSGNANSRWAAFGLNEPLLQEFHAKTSYADTRIGGWIFLSQGHFGWISYTDAQNRAIKTLIPWSNIMDIVPTSRVKGQATKTYQFAPIMAPGAIAEGFQIFTRDNLVYQFFGLKKNIDQVFALFGNLWVPHYGTRTGFTSGLHHGGFVRSTGNTGMGQTTYVQQPMMGQTGYGTTGLAGQTTYVQQPMMGQTGYTNTGLVGGQTHHNPLDRNHDGRVNAADLHPNRTGLAGQTGYVQQPMMGQTGLVGNSGLGQTGYVQQPMMGQTGLANNSGLVGQTGYAQQPMMGQTGLVGGQTHHNPLDRNHDGRVNLQDLHPNQTGYTQQTGLGQTGLVGNTGYVQQPMMGQTTLDNNPLWDRPSPARPVTPPSRPCTLNP